MWASSCSQGCSKALGARVFRSTLNFLEFGCFLDLTFSRVMLALLLSVLSRNLGILRVGDTWSLGWQMEPIWDLPFFWMLVQFPPQNWPTRFDSVEKQCPCVETGE